MINDVNKKLDELQIRKTNNAYHITRIYIHYDVIPEIEYTVLLVADMTDAQINHWDGIIKKLQHI
jgi:hypothetical protein